MRQNQKGRVAPVPRLQTWLATMLGRSAAKRPEPALPAIVATLEPVSAARFQMALASAARRITEAGAGHPSVPILLASSSDELRQLLPRLRGAAIIVATLDRWLWELEGANLLYLQPGWMILEEALSAIIGDVDAKPGRPPVVALDRLFSRGRRLSLETLFYKPETAAQRANDWCGLPLFEAGDFGEADADKYREASAALLRIVQRRPLVDTARMVSFPVGGTYATSGDGPGVFALGAGWSHPESDHTWSDGPRAVLAIRVEDCRARRLRLRLDGTLAPGPCGCGSSSAVIPCWRCGKARSRRATSRCRCCCPRRRPPIRCCRSRSNSVAPIGRARPGSAPTRVGSDMRCARSRSRKTRDLARPCAR